MHGSYDISTQWTLCKLLCVWGHVLRGMHAAALCMASRLRFYEEERLKSDADSSPAMRHPQVISAFGTVFVDQAYWQSAIAARPSASVRGYLLGGLLWFSIPFTLATSIGERAAPTFMHDIRKLHVSQASVRSGFLTFCTSATPSPSSAIERAALTFPVQSCSYRSWPSALQPPLQSCNSLSACTRLAYYDVSAISAAPAPC